MRGVGPDDVERWLSPAARACLPFSRLLRLYLDPFALFKDASGGPASVRQRAMTYNRTMRWMLLAYMRRWLVIATSLFLVIAPAEAMAAQKTMVLLPACAAVACCVSVAVIVSAAAAYLLLGLRR